MSRLSMNELTTYRWSFEEDVRQYHAAGFEGIRVWREKLADYGEEKGIELLAEMGLSVSTLMWAGGFTGSDGRSHSDAIDDGLSAIRLAAELQAGCLVVHSGARASHTQNHARRLLRLALKNMLPLAADLGVVLALEPMHAGCAAGWTFLTDLDEALEVVHSFDSESLKITFDSYHLTHDETILQRLPDLVSSIALVQLGDARNVPRGEQNRCRLCEGLLPLDRVVSTLVDSGYNGFFDIELMGEDIESADYHSLLAHSRQTFDELLGSAQTK